MTPHFHDIESLYAHDHCEEHVHHHDHADHDHEDSITITNATVTEPVKKFSQFVFTQASQETCSCAA
mgnify:CR=1 FL=1